MSGIITSVNLAESTGRKKLPVDVIELVAGSGVLGDAHAGTARQLSLLAAEQIADAAQRTGMALSAGDFGENLTISGLPDEIIQIGQRFAIGDTALVQISEIGKDCLHPCTIGQRLGDCIMPRAGRFALVMRGGRVTPGDVITPVKIYAGAIITASDRCARGERGDTSGPLLVRLLEELGVVVTHYSILADDEEPLSEKMRYLADRCAVDVILTTGGTGLGTRDRMPEATLAVLEQLAPGFSEAIRATGMPHTPLAYLSRGISGLRGRTLIINLPGSRRAIDEIRPFLRSVLPHSLALLRNEVTDCGARPRPTT